MTIHPGRDTTQQERARRRIPRRVRFSVMAVDRPPVRRGSRQTAPCLLVCADVDEVRLLGGQLVWWTAVLMFSCSAGGERPSSQTSTACTQRRW